MRAEDVSVLERATYDQLWSLLITELGIMGGERQGERPFVERQRRLRWAHALAVEIRRRGDQLSF